MWSACRPRCGDGPVQVGSGAGCAGEAENLEHRPPVCEILEGSIGMRNYVNNCKWHDLMAGLSQTELSLSATCTISYGR